MKIAAIIPARMESSRYPGKALVEFDSIPMVEHVRRRALLCKEFSQVVVATCNEEIYSAIKKFDGDVVMTAPTHAMASDRVAEAAEKLDCTHIINVQGDEILVLPEDLTRMALAIKANPGELFWNALAEIESKEELSDTSIVKCAVSVSGRIMYCSRDFSSLGLKNEFQPIKKILGILGYSREGLVRFGELKRTPLETTQSIDQSRVLEHDLVLNAVDFSRGYPGINEPREAELVREILKSNDRQRQVLNQIIGRVSGE